MPIRRKAIVVVRWCNRKCNSVYGSRYPMFRRSNQEGLEARKLQEPCVATVAELVDATDLKSVGHYDRVGSIPTSGTN